MRRTFSGLTALLALACAGPAAPAALGALSHPAPPTTPATSGVLGVVGDTALALVAQVQPLRQRVLPGTLLVLRHRHHDHARVSRADSQFFAISATGGFGVPEAALHAYHHAADSLARSEPGCHLSWTFLAAIGRVESDHGRYGGAQLGADGISRPAIIGPRLDGAGPFAAIPDTDHGRLDGDKRWDRAVGQMQFLPATWRAVGRDGDGDGIANPDDINDSALSAGVYLCGAGDLSTRAGMARAAYRYNQSDYYVALVLSFETGYRTGVFTEPTPPAPPKASTTRHPRAKHHHATTTTKPRHHSGPTSSGGSGAATPTPTPAPAPAPPTPAALVLTTLKGSWSACPGGYCVAGTSLDLGPASRLSGTAAGDFDNDGTVESVADEFAGLVGQHVTLQVDATKTPVVVYVINKLGLRNADGSFA